MKMVYACKHALLSVCRDVRNCVLMQYRVEVVHKNCFSRPHEDGKNPVSFTVVLMASILDRHTFLKNFHSLFFRHNICFA